MGTLYANVDWTLKENQININAQAVDAPDKTTIIKAAAGLHFAAEGSVYVDSNDAALVGADILRHFHVDIAFVSANGFSEKGELNLMHQGNQRRR